MCNRCVEESTTDICRLQLAPQQAYQETHWRMVPEHPSFRHRMNRSCEDCLSLAPAQVFPASHQGPPWHISVASVKSSHPSSQTLPLCSLCTGCTVPQGGQSRFHCPLCVLREHTMHGHHWWPAHIVLRTHHYTRYTY